VDVKKMVYVIGIASFAMLAWVTFKVWFIHDPDNFFFGDAKPHAVAWMIDNCKKYKCDYSGGGDGTAIKEVFEVEEGWIFVIATHTDEKEVALLIPRDNPRKKHLVELEPAS
jgi:hypothetical protein